MAENRVKINDRGQLNFIDARSDGGFQVELAELTGLPIGFVAGLGDIAWEADKHHKEAQDKKELLYQYLDEVLGE